MVAISFIFLILFQNILETAVALTTPAQKLKTLIQKSRDRPILLPGVHDALSASIFHQAGGVECLFLSGFGVSASYLGQPDAGILTLNEMEDMARRLVNAVDGQIPVIVDGDTGFGGCHNLRRQIRGFARAGAACISIEDQVFPKKCTYIQGDKGSNVVSRESSMARVRTALAAAKEAFEKDGNEVLIIARTDSRAQLGLEEATRRCREYETLGADIVYAENLQAPEEYQQLRSAISPEIPMILAQVQLNDPHKPQVLYSLPEIHELGYNFALMGVTALQAQVQALQNAATNMLENHGLVPPEKSGSLASFSTLKRVVGYEDLEDFEGKYYCE